MWRTTVVHLALVQTLIRTAVIFIPVERWTSFRLVFVLQLLCVSDGSKPSGKKAGTLIHIWEAMSDF